MDDRICGKLYQCKIILKTGGSLVKNLPANAGDAGLILGGKTPWRRKGQPTRGDWLDVVYGVVERAGHDLVTKQPQR